MHAHFASSFLTPILHTHFPNIDPTLISQTQFPNPFHFIRNVVSLQSLYFSTKTDTHIYCKSRYFSLFIFRSGAIWTVVPLDRETNSFYQFYVMARDGGDQSKFSSVLVTVNVIDVNDEPPRFEQPSYNFSIAENTHGRTKLGQVAAFDP